MSQKVLFNPITESFLSSLNSTYLELSIAVPFISTFAKKLLSVEILAKIKHKRILTCFNSENINTFELDTLKYLLDNKVELRYNNSIHLKLYLFDSIGYISSSNLTSYGFENRVELTSSISDENIDLCRNFFDGLWNGSQNSIITEEVINENYSKYLLLKKHSRNKPKRIVSLNSQEVKNTKLNVDKLVEYVFKEKKDYSFFINNAFEANAERNLIKEKVSGGFSIGDYYLDLGHSSRKETLFYKLLYGPENRIAGTGLRENQFKAVFLHSKFEEIISHIYPPIIGEKEWNLRDEETFREFCNGIFEIRIPQYSETLPIRLASYFYPNNFLPIFRLKHLEEVCAILGLRTDANSKGDKLYIYNKYLLKKMESIPYDNYVKSNIAYILSFTVELFNRLSNGEKYKSIEGSYREKWKKEYINRGKEILINMNLY